MVDSSKCPAEEFAANSIGQKHYTGKAGKLSAGPKQVID